MTARVSPPPSPPPPLPSPEAQDHSSAARTPQGGRKWQRQRRLLSVLLVAAAGVAVAAWISNLRPWEIPVPGSGGSSGSVSRQEIRSGTKPSSLGTNTRGGDGDDNGGGTGGGDSNSEAGVTSDHHHHHHHHHHQQQQQQQRFFSFDAPDGPSAPGVGHGHDHQQQQQFQQRERRPSCAATTSDDPGYSCLLARPPGSFKDEISVYLSLSRSEVRGDGGRQQQGQDQQGHVEEEEEQQLLLSVKVVVPAPASSRQGKGAAGGAAAAGWASLGFSPNGRMAGPSEAVVGFVGGRSEESMTEPSAGVLRYRMDGYSAASVTPLPAQEQILTGQAVEIASNGSLVVRFKRPLLEPSTLSHGQGACTAPMMGGGIGRADLEGDEPQATAAAASAATRAWDIRSEGMGWMDPREEGVVLLWAYGRGAWPSYHDATGAFLLPGLALEG